jgi:riboflavin synthase
VNAVGCDSVITLNLTINNSDQRTDVITACNTYTWIDGMTYTSSNNTATKQYTNAVGCDSIITLDLTINTTQYATAVVSACESYTWNGVVYTSNNNTALDTLVNAAGCDSIVTLNLTILNSTTSIETVTECDFYTFNGVIYTSSNTTATKTLVNAVGCDSVITLNLTILNSTSFTDVITSCNPITWIDGITYTSSNDTATFRILNSIGCDSNLTLDFTLLNASAATDAITSCKPITWIDGVTYKQTTNTPVFTILNSQGCDSVVTLDFTLLEVDTAVTRNYLTLTAQANNAAYQWIDCANGFISGETNASFTATVNGSYQVEITQNGCVDTSDCFTIANVGVQEAELIGINVYPNPVSDLLHIDKGSNVALEITITNNVGAVVHQSTSSSQITTINLNKMATGIYIVTLKNERGVKVEKVVKR